MNAKKLIAGILAGTMVLGTASVTTFAAPSATYQATQKVGAITNVSTSLKVGATPCTWFTPNTFSDALQITDKPVTVTFNNVGTATTPDMMAWCIVYSSTTGACYGGNGHPLTGDESYTAGVAAKAHEYIAIRGDAYAYTYRYDTSTKSGELTATEWTADGVIDYSKLKDGIVVNKVGDLPESWTTYTKGAVLPNGSDCSDWAAAIKDGVQGKIVAYLKDSKTAVIDYTLNGVTTETTIPLTGTNNTYFCLGADNGTIKDVKYSYSLLSQSDVKVTLSGKTSYTYNGKVQKPTVKVTDKNGAAIAASNYTVTYSNASSKKVGSYQIKVSFKAGTPYEGFTDSNFTYTINKAKQTLKLKATSVKVKVNTVKKKKKTVKMYVKGNSTTIKVTSMNKKAVTVKKAKKSSKKGYTQYNLTVKKGTKKGTYKVTMYAKSNANYKQSAVKTFKVKVVK